MRHIIDITDLTAPQWHELFRRCIDILEHTDDYKDACRGKLMASVFYEPSTRTNFSFQAAMMRLGGDVFGFSDPLLSSCAKGETLKDTVIMMSGYSDVLVCRHPREGAAMAASIYSSCPVVNAGDGGHLHPTQTMTDLAALTYLRGKVDGLNLGICGDLKNGRTVHSLIRALTWFEDIHLYLISPGELCIPSYLHRFMREKKLCFTEVTALDSVMEYLDALYMTRIQRERFTDSYEYEKYKGVYVLNSKKLANAKKEMLILHPLPRVDEIHQQVDSDPRAAYFIQARLGMYIRMALLLELTHKEAVFPKMSYQEPSRVCNNPNCITAFEEYLPSLQSNYHCLFCDSELI